MSFNIDKAANHQNLRVLTIGGFFDTLMWLDHSFVSQPHFIPHGCDC